MIGLALMTSCQEKIGQEAPDQNSEKYSCELPAAYVNGKQAWVPGDQILIHGKAAKDKVVVTLTPADISEDGKTCYVNFGGIEPYTQSAVKSKYYLAYPAQVVGSSSKDINNYTTTNALLLL